MSVRRGSVFFSCKPSVTQEIEWWNVFDGYAAGGAEVIEGVCLIAGVEGC